MIYLIICRVYIKWRLVCFKKKKLHWVNVLRAQCIYCWKPGIPTCGIVYWVLKCTKRNAFLMYKNKCIFDTKLFYLWKSIGDPSLCLGSYQSSIWLNEGDFWCPMVIGVSEESDKDFDAFSVESMLDLHDKQSEMEPHVCGSHAGVFSLSHLVSMNPGEWSVANDKFLLDFFLSILINLWIEIILIKIILTAPMKKLWGL